MHYQKFSPHASLNSFVVCYYVWEVTPGDEDFIVQSPPNGYLGMVFNYGDPYFICGDESPLGSRVPTSFLVGQQTSNYKLRLTGKIGVIGIVFKPTAIATLFNIVMDKTVNKRIDLSNFLGDEIKRVHEKILYSKTAETRIDCIQRYLLSKLPGYRARLNVADLAADRILSENGNIGVEELASELCVSRRHLERKFLEKVGLSPKYYARIVRMTNISNFVAHHEKIDWQDLIFEGGFHDQNHFVKDFKKLNNESPAKYHLSHRELTRFITMPKK